MSLKNLIIKNRIDDNEVKTIVLNMILLSIFEEIYNYLEKESNKELLKNKLRKSNSEVMIRELIDSHISMALEEDDYKYIYTLIMAYLRKKDIRKRYNEDDKSRLLIKQNYKCDICHCKINLKDSHVDHIIPFKMVGDELNDNYQLLCEQCNFNKSASLNYYLKTIVKRFVKQ